MAHFFVNFSQYHYNQGPNRAVYSTRILSAVQRCYLNSISPSWAWSSPTNLTEALDCIQLTAKPAVLVNDVHLLAACINSAAPSCACGQSKNSARVAVTEGESKECMEITEAIHVVTTKTKNPMSISFPPLSDAKDRNSCLVRHPVSTIWRSLLSCNVPITW